ncbi:MAG: hypothetical protein J1F12_07990 [Muribaculaceae bacterium]|nr:hypothetical protein [Muribaculaceae bacterium]
MKKFLFPALIAILMGSCSHKTTGLDKTSTEGSTTSVAVGYKSGSEKNEAEDNQVKLPERKPLTPEAPLKVSEIIPNATAFRMSGNYSKNVGITVDKEGTLIYFPAPTDITADSEPIELIDGWWLNCQGIGPNSVFIKYTFSEYAALPEVPSPEQLKMDIIPQARVTDFIELPMKITEALENPEAVKDYLKTNNKL